jgi:hypothetical protein
MVMCMRAVSFPAFQSGHFHLRAEPNKSRSSLGLCFETHQDLPVLMGVTVAAANTVKALARARAVIGAIMIYCRVV